MNIYKFAQTCRFLKKDNKVVIANIKNGVWIRMSQEIFKILCIICENDNSNELEYENKIEQEWVESVLEKCKKMNIILPLQTDEMLQNSIASIEMTHRCNLHCIHCCVNAHCDVSPSMDISTINMKNVLDKMIKWNPRSIMLSGGEPLLREDFLELAAYLRSSFTGKLIISTNGTLINISNVKKIVQIADQIDISLDGYNEESCALIRGKGVFKKVMDAVHILQYHGFSNISLSMVISDKNEVWETKFNKLNKELNTIPNCRLFSPTGRGANSKKFFTDLSDKQVFIPSDYIADKQERIVSFSCCSAGSREVFIDYHGDVYPCPSYIDPHYKLGNILKVNSLEEITIKYNHLDIAIKRLAAKGINAHKCKRCCVNIFCWDCPGSVELYNTQEALDYQCKIVYPILVKRVWQENY